MLKVPHNPSTLPATARLDYSDVSTLTDRLMAVADELAQMTPAVASARVVREYHSDRAKRALAQQVREFLIAGDSATAAETKGRASVGFGEAIDKQQAELHIAELAIAEHESKKILWESLRSSLSMAKAIAGNI